MKKGITIYALARKLGCDRDALKGWIEAAGLKPIRIEGRYKYYDEKKATAIAKPYIRKSNQRTAEPNIDPETGLTWRQRHEREMALELARENEIAEAAKNREWIAMPVHRERLKALVDRLEQLPGKLRSQYGLTDTQADGVRREIDEIRKSAAKEIEC